MHPLIASLPSNRSTMDSEESTEGEEEEEWEYDGEVNGEGAPHGRGRAFCTATGVTYVGRFANGVREGPGRLIFSEDEWIDGVHRNGMLEGVARHWTRGSGTISMLFHEDQRVGRMAEEVDEHGKLIYVGEYDVEGRNGKGKHFFVDGGVLEATWKGGTLMDGPATYTFPDGKSKYVGLWKDGDMKEAKFMDENGTLSMNTYEFDPPKGTTIAKYPMVPEPYESLRVFVGTSQGKGEGLFAKRGLKAQEVCAFYTGIHVSHIVVDGRPWEQNEYTISLGAKVVDVPPPFHSLNYYCASLGHKANHSKKNNARYVPFFHPRFGFCKAIRTTRPIRAGEEICCCYGYKRGEYPAWYR